MSTLFLTYVFCLIVGGAFVGLSVLGGLFDADGDFDHDLDSHFGGHLDMHGHLDLDGDGHVDLDLDHDGDIEVRIAPRYSPLTSFKFYTFALAFFGLTGVLFTVMGLWANATGVLVLSIVMGLIAGLAVSYALHKANATSSSDAITERDYVGVTGQVVLPVRAGKRGKVKMHLKGRTIEMFAESADDEVVLDFDEECFVLGVEDGVAKVVHPSALQSRSEN